MPDATHVKYLHINGLFFYLQNQKSYLCGVFGNYPQNEIFSQKSDSVRFFTLKAP